MPGTRNTLIWLRLESSIRARWCDRPGAVSVASVLLLDRMTEIPETKKEQTLGPEMAM